MKCSPPSSNLNESVAVITATQGRASLARCIESISRQSHRKICQYIFVDGSAYWDRTLRIISEVAPRHPVATTLLDRPTGFHGGRIYSSAPHLVNENYLCILDDDNFYSPVHVASLLNLIVTEDLDWSFALRYFFCEESLSCLPDNFESLGPQYPITRPRFSFEKNCSPSMIDTNCFMIKTSNMRKICSSFSLHLAEGIIGDSSPSWNDRYFSQTLFEKYTRVSCSGLLTVYYSLKPSGLLNFDGARRFHDDAVRVYGQNFPEGL